MTRTNVEAMRGSEDLAVQRLLGTDFGAVRAECAVDAGRADAAATGAVTAGHFVSMAERQGQRWHWSGWGTWIRTKVARVRAGSSTAKLSPNGTVRPISMPPLALQPAPCSGASQPAASHRNAFGAAGTAGPYLNPRLAPGRRLRNQAITAPSPMTDTTMTRNGSAYSMTASTNSHATSRNRARVSHQRLIIVAPFQTQGDEHGETGGAASGRSRSGTCRSGAAGSACLAGGVRVGLNWS